MWLSRIIIGLSPNFIVFHMARKKTTGLTEGELRLMDVLWRKKSATVQEIAAGLRNSVVTFQSLQEQRETTLSRSASSRSKKSLLMSSPGAPSDARARG